MTHRNRQDYLTINRSKSKNWILNFRVPESHRSQSPFSGRDTFQCSTKTSDYQAASHFRDAFFREHELFGLGGESSPAEVYWRTFSGAEPVSDEERQLLHEVVEDTVGSGFHLPEPYASRVAGDLKREKGLKDPFAIIQHNYPLDLESLHNEYLKYRDADFVPKTVSRSRRAARTFNEFIGSSKYDFSNVKTTLVFKYIQFLEGRGLHQTTIRGYLTSLGQVFDYAQRLGFINDERPNPFKQQKVRLVKREEKPRLAMPLEYACKLFAKAPNDELALLIAVGHYTGVRISEAFGGTLERDGNQVSLRVADEGGKTKAATRQIPLHEHLWDLISESPLYDESMDRIQWLAPNSDSLGKRFSYFKRKYFNELGIDDKAYVFHSFRHAFSTYLVNSFSELKASELTGHDRGSSSSTELGRTYYKGLDWTEKKMMIQSLPLLNESI